MFHPPVARSLAPSSPGFAELDDADLADELLTGFEDGALWLKL